MARNGSCPEAILVLGATARRRNRGRKDCGEPGQGCISSDELCSGKDKGAKYLSRNGLDGAPGEPLGLEGVAGRNILENR